MMNSFQRWASGYAKARGFTVTARGNWVELHKGDLTIACMSAAGVRTACGETLR